MLGLLAALVAACGAEPYLELQIADPELPFLEPGVDFDALAVEAEASGCAGSETQYAAAPLPATLTILPGECYEGALRVRAAAVLADRRVAQSPWIEAEFPGSGPQVVTAALSDLPGRRMLFATGYEEGEPFAAAGDLTVAISREVVGVVARTSTSGALTGERSALLSGTATGAAARAFARVAAMNVVLAQGDELIFTLELAPGSEILTAGVELELSTGATAEGLMLEDRSGRPIHPASSEGREPGVKQQWITDLSPAAGARLVGVLLAIDPRDAGPGRFELRLDDLAVVRP